MKNIKMKKIIVGLTLSASIFMIGAQNFTFAKNALNESQLNENNTINEDGKVCKEITHKLYLKGYPDESIRRNGDITRDEVAAILNRVYKLDNKNINIQFKDLFESDWSYKDVAANIKAGVLKGYPDGTIRRGAPITRAETAAMLVRLEGDALNKSKPNTDYTNHWASKEIETAIKKGYFVGYEDGSIRPDTNISRAEFATTINRLIGRNYDIKDLEKINIFTDLNFTTKGQWFYEDMVRASNDYIVKECKFINIGSNKVINPEYIIEYEDDTNTDPTPPNIIPEEKNIGYTVEYMLRVNGDLEHIKTVNGEGKLGDIINNNLLKENEYYIAEKNSSGSELVYKLEDKDLVIQDKENILTLIYEPSIVKLRIEYLDFETLEDIVIADDPNLEIYSQTIEAQVGTKVSSIDFIRPYLKTIPNYRLNKRKVPTGNLPTVEQGINPNDDNLPVLNIQFIYKKVNGMDQRPKDPITGLPVDPKSEQTESPVEIETSNEEGITLE